MPSSITERGEVGDGRSPGGGDGTSSSMWFGDEVGVIESLSSSPSSLSPPSGEPSSPPSPENKNSLAYFAKEN